MMFKQATLTAAFVLLGTLPAFAWGSTGHRIVNQAAAQNFPDTLPAFVRRAR